MKKAFVLLMTVLICLGMLAACGGSPSGTAAGGENPKHGEIQALLDEAKAEYDAVAAALEEKGEEGLEDVKAEAGKVADELKTLEQDIAGSKLAEMAEEELDALKEKLAGWKSDLAAMKDKVAAKVEGVVSEAVSVVETDVVVPTEAAFNTLLADARGEYDRLAGLLETAEVEGKEDIQNAMDAVKTEIETLESKVAESAFGQWVEQEQAEVHAGLLGLHERLAEMRDQLEGKPAT